MKPIRNITLANLLLAKRLELGLTQKEVAEKAGIRFHNFYGRMEREGFIPKQRHKIIQLAEVLKLDPSVLINESINTKSEIVSQIGTLKFIEPILTTLLPGISSEDIVFVLGIQKLFSKPLPRELIEGLIHHRKQN